MKKLIILITLNLIGHGLTDVSNEYINNMIQTEIGNFRLPNIQEMINNNNKTYSTKINNTQGLETYSNQNNLDGKLPPEKYTNRPITIGDGNDMNTRANFFRNNKNTMEINTKPIITNCVQSQTISLNQNTCKGELIFEETFQTSQLNSKVWSKEIRIPSDFDDADFVSYQDERENCYIKNNQLHIVPTLLENTDGFNADKIRTGTLNFEDRCTAVTTNYVNECSRTAQYSRILPPIVSARIGTRQNFSFRYGRIEIKAKLPKGDWIFPQLLLEPYSTRPYGDKGYASGQIRIAFIRGNDILSNKKEESIDGFRLYGGVVVTVGEDQRQKFLINTLKDKHLSDDFHVYSMIWTNESMTFELDGEVYGKIDGGFSSDRNLKKLKQSEKWHTGEFMAPFDREFFISLGVSAGGISDFPDGSKTGRRGTPKPWVNTDPKAELSFWKDRTNWYPTWNGEDAGLKVDYIKVWAL